MQGLSQRKVALTLCLFGLSQSGCDIVQGFRDASAAVFPEEKTYFDAPGYRLVRGGFRQLEFASGSSLYLLGRPADREEASLYVMRYDNPQPCLLPNIKEHSGGVGVFLEATTIAFTEEGTRNGTLRFSDGDCNVYPLRVSGSYIPFGETPEGFLTYQGSDLVIVNPVTGVIRTVASDAQFIGAFSAFYVLLAKGRIGAFKPAFTEVAWLGDGVVRAGGAGSSFFFEDKLGIHRVTALSVDSVHDVVISSGGCKLGFPRNLGSAENWVTYHSPCDAKKLIVFSESVAQASALDITVDDPNFMAFLPVFPAQTGDPATDPFFAFYLADWDDKNRTGTLWMRGPDRQAKVLGERAELGRLAVYPTAAETHGYAVIDVNGDIGKFIRWEVDGSTRTVAENVVRGNGDLVTNYDGATGQFQLFSDRGLSVVSHRIPPYNFKSREPKGRWTAIIDDFEKPNGTLSITESALDFNESEKTLGPPPKLEVIARGVLWDGRARFVPALPGIGYFTHYDETNDIGRLEYRNLELRFTATVSEGVADYLATAGGLIYSVPYGDGAGIWVVRSR
jgi:hypothetical protein